MSHLQRAILTIGLLAEAALCLYPPMAITMTLAGGITAGRTEHMFLFGQHGGAWRIELGRFVALALLIGAATALAWILCPLRNLRRPPAA